MPTIFTKPWPDYRTIWRWHFFAGLFCLPFVIVLCVTGSIYLFRPQIDRWIDWRYDHLLPSHATATPRQEVDAALRALPGGRLLAYELPPGPHAAARVIVDRHGSAIRVYIDPGSLHVLKTVDEDWRFERIIFRLHGQLMLGNTGSIIMEMVASWTIVLIVTGIYLWWPRARRGGGAIWPRLATPGRARLRDLHAVTGAWISALLALFLVSGLPWSFVWGHALARVETAVGRVQSLADWQIGAVPARVELAAAPDSMPGMDMGPSADAQASGAALDTVVAAAMPLGLAAPVLVTPPAPGTTAWQVRSDTQNRPRRASAMIDPSGRLLSIHRFASKGVMDRIIGYGVAAHEGQLFGIANQIVNLAVALGLTVMSAAALVMWLRRRPSGMIGAPSRLPDGRIGAGGIALMLALGLVLPELGVCLMAIAIACAIASWREGRTARRGA